MSTVSENIKYLRKLKGYTQEQFAERIGIKRSLVGAYEEARANPNEIYLDSIAEVLGVEVEHLLHENLKERGRRLGAGMILKLNPGLPEADTVNEAEEKPKEIPATTPVEEKVKPAQMDLFHSQAEAVSRPESATQKPPVSVTGPDTDREESSFVSVFAKLLSGQTGYKLFSDLNDLPVSGACIVGKILEGAENIENNELYVVVTREGKSLFRRAFNQVAIKGTVILSSDFPDKPTLELTVAAIAEVYHYVATISTEAPSRGVPAQRLRVLAEEMARLLNS